MARTEEGLRLSIHPSFRSTAELIALALAELDLTADDPCPATAVLHRRGTREVLEAALALCRSPITKQRALGAEILGQLGSPRSFPEEAGAALAELLRHDQHLDVLARALFAFGHLGSHDHEAEILAFRAHPVDRLRHGVAFALCGATTPDAVAALLELMDDPCERVRDWATTSIGQTVSLDGPEIRAALLRRGQDSCEIIRAEAFHGLAQREDARVRPRLIAELSAAREHLSLFADAAKTCLDLDSEREIDAKALVAALKRAMTLPMMAGTWAASAIL
jgi:HEAT repeat protein